MYKKIITANKILICAVLCCSLIMLGIVSTSAQTVPSDVDNSSSSQLDAKAQEIKNQIIKIGLKNDIMIIGKNKREFYGSVLEIKDNSVSVKEIDQKVNIEINYQQIKKVRKGYGSSKNRFGNRIPTRTTVIATAVIAGLLLFPIILLATAKD